MVFVPKSGFSERSQDFLINEGVLSSDREQSGESNMDDLELPLFDFNTITMATNNFSEENKLGQGGFGSVYKVSSFDRCRHKRVLEFTYEL